MRQEAARTKHQKMADVADTQQQHASRRSQYHDRVFGLDAKDRRRRLGAIYEQNRKRPEGYKRPVHIKRSLAKASKRRTCKGLENDKGLGMNKVLAVTCSPPVMQSDSEAEFAVPGVTLPVETTNQEDTIKANRTASRKSANCIKAELPASQKVNQAMQSDLAASLKENQALQKELAASQKEKQALQKKLAASQKENQALQKELAASQKENQALQKELAASQKENQTMQSELAASLKENQALQKELAEKEAKLNMEQKKNAALDAVLSESMKEMALQKKQLRWHENVRDWVSNTGAECAVHVAKRGELPPWVQFQGQTVEYS